MASTQACHKTISHEAAWQRCKPAIRALALSSSLRPPSPRAAHAHRACLLQQFRRFAVGGALSQSSADASTDGGTDALGASQPRTTTEALAPWATTAVISPLLLSLLQPLAASAALESLASAPTAVHTTSAAITEVGMSLVAGMEGSPGGGRLLFEVADVDAKTAGTIALFLQPLLSICTLLMIVRIVLTWYPQLDGKRLPWSIAVAPTEPVLGPTRRAIPPVGGVDVAPIVWVAVLSFINEILLGPQGILNLLQRKAEL